MTVAIHAEPGLRGGGCAHLVLDALGSGGGLTYRQCRVCGDVLITTGGRTWVVPRTD